MRTNNSICLISRDKRTEGLFRNSWIEAAEELKIPINTLQRKKRLNFFFFKAIFQKFKEAKLITFGVSEALILFWLRPDIVVITGFGRLFNENFKLRKFLFLLLNLMYKNTLLISLNKDDFRILKSLGFHKVLKINGEGFQKKKVDKASLLRSGDFLYVGRLLKSKGINVIIDSFLECNFSNKTLNIVGDRDFNNSDSLNEKEINYYKSKSKGAIRFFGFKKELSKFYKKGAVYISASKREGMPFSVLEALDMNLYCLLSNVPGHKEFKDFPNVSLFSSAEELKRLMFKNFSNFDTKLKNELLSKYKKSEVKKNIKQIYSSFF